MACLIALLRMPSMVESWRSLNTPKWVAWYLDLSSYSTIVVLRLACLLYREGLWNVDKFVAF